MPPRFRTSILFAFVLVTLYLLFPFGSKDVPSENGNPVADLNGAGTGTGTGTGKGADVKEKPLPSAIPSGSALPASTGPVTQKEFNKEFDALGLQETAGKIYGSTLNTLVAAGNHAGFAATALTPTENWTPYNDAPPFTYNPYPEYNNKAWNTSKQGTYKPCDGPDGKVLEVVVFSGHPEVFDSPALGSFVPLQIDSNLCFERESRLGAYGYQEEGSENTGRPRRDLQERTDWNTVNWGKLQELCYQKNAGRYSQVENMPEFNNSGFHNATYPNGTSKDSGETIVDEAEARGKGLHGLPQGGAKSELRTAVLLRSYSGRNYTENDKQNIRSLVTELSLRSGGEYQVYLLVHIKDNISNLTDPAVHEKAVHDNVPEEFWEMAVLWDDAIMTEWYPKIPKEVNNVNQSQWLSVQKFAQENPQFDYFWNWELDSRYTGHHYNFLEKLASFSQAQPRKYLWERNERYYIPSYHGPYEGKFRVNVESISGQQTIWGPPSVPDITPTGNVPPVMDPKEGTYDWGVGEEADFISLSPIFDPVKTTWPARDEVWGYVGPTLTPRRGSIGMQSRCSRKLLNVMHEENKKGNHVSSEMTASTVALLHGLKAVYAPIPIFFDRQWEGAQLNKWFNPGPNGVSGSTEESPFSEGREGRFEASTWFDLATPPMRLYNIWLGWEDSGIGGVEWEKSHGRTCLPPMLLRPIRNVVKPPAGH